MQKIPMILILFCTLLCNDRIVNFKTAIMTRFIEVPIIKNGNSKPNKLFVKAKTSKDFKVRPNNSKASKILNTKIDAPMFTKFEKKESEVVIPEMKKQKILLFSIYSFYEAYKNDFVIPSVLERTKQIDLSQLFSEIKDKDEFRKVIESLIKPEHIHIHLVDNKNGRNCEAQYHKDQLLIPVILNNSFEGNDSNFRDDSVLFASDGKLNESMDIDTTKKDFQEQKHHEDTVYKEYKVLSCGIDFKHIEAFDIKKVAVSWTINQYYNKESQKVNVPAWTIHVYLQKDKNYLFI